MGDVPPSSVPANEYGPPDAFNSAYQGISPNDGQGSLPQGPSPLSNTGLHAQYQQVYGSSPNAFANQLDMTQGQTSGRQGPYNMTAMANSLSASNYRGGYHPGQQQQPQPPQPQRYNVGSGPNMMPPGSQMNHFTGTPGLPQMAGQQYYLAQHPYYNAQISPTSQQQPSSQHANMSSRHNMNMGYYPTPVMMNPAQQSGPTGYYYPHSNHLSGPSPTMHGQLGQAQFPMHGDAPDGTRGPTPSQGNNYGGGLGGTGVVDGSFGDKSNVVRGPPRKPRQSGHAIWIGNLPPQTDLMNLVHHVCKEAAGLESLFLISKSNCAFANFRDDQSCVTAQQKLHDSKFQSVRLVSRLRKSTVEGSAGQTAPTGPAATSNAPIAPAAHNSQDTPPEPASATDYPTETELTPKSETAPPKDKFFILKSLTVEDLELSIRNGVWATQSHNEEVLNNAFKTVDNVYLVFSANKSGEYFGYARMVSPINDDPAAAIEFAPKAQATSNLDLPKAIPTEATDTCPKGRIIDDSARGTIFWEVERDEEDNAAVTEEESEDSGSARSGQDGEANSKAWGKPFKLEWLSSNRLPFYRTRGLRNPWNSNREVKIARDGTELEPSVGRKLIGLFNRVQSPIPPIHMGMPGRMPMAAGYPPPMPPPYRP